MLSIGSILGIAMELIGPCKVGIDMNIGRSFNRVLSLFGLVVTKRTNEQMEMTAERFLQPAHSRIVYRFEHFFATRSVEGVIIEAGVGTGWGMGFWMSLKRYFRDSRIVWGFDSFSGFPESFTNESTWFQKHYRMINDQYKMFDLPYVTSKMNSLELSDSELTEFRLVEGHMPDSFQALGDRKVSLLNVDGDLYQTVRDTLDFFVPRMQPGARILLDEYDLPDDLRKWPGAKVAVDEICEKYGLVLSNSYGGRPYILIS